MHFSAPLFHWQGPAPHYFLRVPDDLAADLKAASRLVTYGWGMIPVTVVLAGWQYDTSLFPKGGGYLVPVRADARKVGGWQEGDEVDVVLEIRVGKAGRGLRRSEQ